MGEKLIIPVVVYCEYLSADKLYGAVLHELVSSEEAEATATEHEQEEKRCRNMEANRNRTLAALAEVAAGTAKRLGTDWHLPRSITKGLKFIYNKTYQRFQFVMRLKPGKEGLVFEGEQKHGRS